MKVKKHLHRKGLIAQKKAKGRYSRVHLPKPSTCAFNYACQECWALTKRKNCLWPCNHYNCDC